MKTPEEILNSKVYCVNRLKELVEVEYSIKYRNGTIFFDPRFEGQYDKCILPHELNEKVSEFILTILPLEYEKIYDKFVGFHDEKPKKYISLNKEKFFVQTTKYMCSLYKCPLCTEVSISNSDNFCPYCGVEIEWI